MNSSEEESKSSEEEWKSSEEEPKSRLRDVLATRAADVAAATTWIKTTGFATHKVTTAFGFTTTRATTWIRTTGFATHKGTTALRLTTTRSSTKEEGMTH